MYANVILSSCPPFFVFFWYFTYPIVKTWCTGKQSNCSFVFSKSSLTHSWLDSKSILIFCHWSFLFRGHKSFAIANLNSSRKGYLIRAIHEDISWIEWKCLEWRRHFHQWKIDLWNWFFLTKHFVGFFEKFGWIFLLSTKIVLSIFVRLEVCKILFYYLRYMASPQ